MKRKVQKGFTLIELTIAMFIGAIVILAAGMIPAKNLMLKSEIVEIVGDNSISKTILDDKVEALQFNVTGTTVDSTDSE